MLYALNRLYHGSNVSNHQFLYSQFSAYSNYLGFYGINENRIKIEIINDVIFFNKNHTDPGKNGTYNIGFTLSK